MKHFILTVLILTCASCNSSEYQSERSSVNGEWTKQISSLFEKLRKTNPELSVEELQKLHQFEYKVFHIDAHNSSLQITRELNEVGKDKWDCFHIERLNITKEQNGDVLQIYCKRNIQTPLRYVPQSILGR